MDAVMELEIGPGPDPGSYVARVLRSVGRGEPTETITLDLDDLLSRRPHLDASVLWSSVSARRVRSDVEAVLQDVGRRLFYSAFTGSITGEEHPEDRIFTGANTASVIGRLNTIPRDLRRGRRQDIHGPAQGNLQLGVNDTDLDDDSGEFGAFVTLNQ